MCLPWSQGPPWDHTCREAPASSLVGRRLRTNNSLERLNREIKRRTRVATLFPNDASLLRLATAVLMETDEEWQSDMKL